MASKRVEKVAFAMLNDVPEWCNDVVQWKNLPNEVREKLTPRRSHMQDYLPGSVFDAVFNSIDRPASLYEYRIAIDRLQDLDGVIDSESQEAIRKLVDAAPIIFENLLRIVENSFEPDEDLAALLNSLEDLLKKFQYDKGEKDDQTSDGNEEDSNVPDASDILVEMETKLKPMLSANETVSESDRLKKRFLSQKGSISTTSKLLLPELQRQTACGLCRKAMKDPKTLPCLHSFCGNCLKAGFSPGKESEPATITCTRCATKFSSDKDLEPKLAMFPANSVLAALNHTIDACVTGVPKCSECIGVDPVCVCVHCCAMFCHFHRARCFHRQNETIKTHTLIDFEDILLQPGKIQGIIYQLCLYHKKPFVKFCQMCQISICSDEKCIVQHQNHTLHFVRDITVPRKQVLTQLDRDLAEKVKLLLEKSRNIEEGEITLGDIQKEIEDSIQRYFDDIQDTLETRRQAFLSTVQSIAEECLQHLEVTRDRLKTSISNSQKVTSDYQSLFSTTGDTQDNVNQLEAARVSYLKQVTDCADGATLAQARIISYPEGQLRALLTSVTALKPDFTAFSRDHGWENVVRSPGIKSFCVDGQRIFYIKDTVFTSQVFAQELSGENLETRTLTDATTTGLSSLAIVPGGRLAVIQNAQSILDLKSMALRRSVSLRIYNSRSGEIIKLYPLSLQPTAGRCWVKTQGKNYHICDGTWVTEYVDNQDGGLTILRRFNFHNMIDIADFQPQSVGTDVLWVTDKAKHRLLVFDSNQQVVKSIGEEGPLANTFQNPLAVTCDRFGHVIVADAGNRRLQFFDQNGSFLKIVPYPTSFKDENLAGQLAASVELATQNSYVYLHDSREDTIFRMKYI